MLFYEIKSIFDNWLPSDVLFDRAPPKITGWTQWQKLIKKRLKSWIFNQ